MAKRVLLLVPQGLTFDMLTPEQQAAINLVFGKYINPMPTSIIFNGMQIVDALTGDNFDPSTMANYGIDWPVLGICQWDGVAEYVTIIQPLDTETYKHYMPDGSLTECHRWAGWPDGAFSNEFSGGFFQ